MESLLVTKTTPTNTVNETLFSPDSVELHRVMIVLPDVRESCCNHPSNDSRDKIIPVLYECRCLCDGECSPGDPETKTGNCELVERWQSRGMFFFWEVNVGEEPLWVNQHDVRRPSTSVQGRTALGATFITLVVASCVRRPNNHKLERKTLVGDGTQGLS